ncbi:MAG: YebC/PmpR family DNA-binding transcriptional regulator [Rickettsiales bacterium]|jgi:YebC/PmpR family DNA-binding regulatory protein|nr:YebC/PmpR family DNA-binding transcriptional regulator [Rickettsiales bacterium]
MAGHSQFANIKHRKGAQDKKRAKIFTKLTREIITAAKSGLPDPAMNARLRNAIIAARAENLPKDKIDSAIKRASNPHEGDNYEEMRYEGYLGGGIAFIIEALTDNRNRTASDVRSCFSKHGGALGEAGSVSFMFDRIGLIEFNAEVSDFDKFFEEVLEAGAEDCINEEEVYVVTTNPDDLNEVREYLVNKFGDPKTVKLSWKPQNTIEVSSSEQAETLYKFIEALEDSDDVQNIIGNFTLSKEVIEKLN